MKKDPDCIFCKIVAGEAPSHAFWQNADYLAFLSIFPNTEGVSVVIPKEHHGSYFAEAPEEVMLGLVKAAKDVALLIDERLPDVGRTALVFEGFGVNHLHAKLFPMHGTKEGEWREHKSDVSKYFENYEGYISTHDHDRADDAELAATAKKLKGE